MRSQTRRVLLLLLLACLLASPSPVHAAGVTSRGYGIMVDVDGTAYVLAYDANGKYMGSSPAGGIPSTASSITLTMVEFLLYDPSGIVSSSAELTVQGQTSTCVPASGGVNLIDLDFMPLNITLPHAKGSFSVPYTLQVDLLPSGKQTFSGRFAYGTMPTDEDTLTDDFTATPADDPAALPQLRVAHVAEAANIRSGPGLEYPVVATVPLHAPLALVSTDGDWLQVYYNDGTALGWIHASLTEAL